ncbi:MAG: protein kinase [Planctomycetota bacterium]
MSPRPTRAGHDTDDATPTLQGSRVEPPATTPRAVPASSGRSAKIGGLALREELGRGGMGRVWSADDGELRREVAIKLLHNPDNPTAVQRFIEEAQITGQLEHPNVVPIHQLGRDAQGRPWMAMKRVRGNTLRDWIARREKRPAPITPDEAGEILDIFGKVCDAVAFAHNRHVIHRDLKPENIMVGEFGEVLVMDWGLARTVDDTLDAADDVVADDDADADARLAARPPSGPAMATARATTPAPRVVTNRGEGESFVERTVAGEIFGTPSYMAPEQAKGQPTSPATDIFALGAILYHLLTLRMPYTGKDTMQVVMAAARRDLIEPRRRAPQRRIARELAAIVMRAMEANPRNRYATVEDLRADINAWRTFQPVSAYRPGLVDRMVKWARRHPTTSTAGAVAVLLLCVLGVVVSAMLAAGARKDQALAEQQRESEANARVAEEQKRIAAETAAEAARLAEDKFRAEVITRLQENQIEELRSKLGVKLRRKQNAARDKWAAMCRNAVGSAADVELLAAPLPPGEVKQILEAYDELFAEAEAGNVQLQARDYYERALLRGVGLVDVDAAMADVEVALKLDPTLWEAWLLHAMGRVYQYDRPEGPSADLANLGPTGQQVADALADVSKAVELASDNPAVWCVRAQIYLWQKQFNEARADLDTAYRLDNRYPTVWTLRGLTLARLGLHDQAGRCYDQAVEYGRNTPAPWIARGTWRLDHGVQPAARVGQPPVIDEALLRAAVDDLTAALALAPQAPVALQTRARARFELGDHDEALKDLDAAIHIRPNDYLNHYYKSVMLLRMRKLVTAIAEFNMAIDLAPPVIKPALEAWRKSLTGR